MYCDDLVIKKQSGPILVKLAFPMGFWVLLHSTNHYLTTYLMFMHTDYFETIPPNKSHHLRFIINFITELFILHTCFTYVRKIKYIEKIGSKWAFAPFAQNK